MMSDLPLAIFVILGVFVMSRAAARKSSIASWPLWRALIMLSDVNAACELGLQTRWRTADPMGASCRS